MEYKPSLQHLRGDKLYARVLHAEEYTQTRKNATSSLRMSCHWLRSYSHEDPLQFLPPFYGFHYLLQFFLLMINGEVTGHLPIASETHL